MYKQLRPRTLLSCLVGSLSVTSLVTIVSCGEYCQRYNDRKESYKLLDKCVHQLLVTEIILKSYPTGPTILNSSVT